MGKAYGFIAIVLTALAGAAYEMKTLKPWSYWSIVVILLVVGAIIAKCEGRSDKK